MKKTDLPILVFHRRIVGAAFIVIVLSLAWSVTELIAPNVASLLPLPPLFIAVGLTALSGIILFVSVLKSYSPAAQTKTLSELVHELSQVENKSEIVINAIGDGVVALDNKGIVQLINPAAQSIIGWDKRDAVDLDFRSIFKLQTAKGEPLPEELNPVQRVLGGNPTITTDELTLLTNSGKKMNVSLLVSPLGQFGSGAIVVFRDITSQMSENQQKAEFVSTASHEMRTPVAAIEGYLGLALNPATAQVDDKARVYLTKAHESAQHLGRLFQDLLDVSKAEDGRLKSDLEVIELVGFLRETIATLTTRATDKGLLLVYKPDVSEDSQVAILPIYHIEADPDHLREVMTNLIDNAIKYTKSGSVTVDISGTTDTVKIAITDSGIGIAREDIPHLFQKFYRINNSDTREIGGTGLGLYLCRRLVESMNGRIWVESEQGSGSTFFVELGRLSEEEVAKREHAKTPATETA